MSEYFGFTPDENGDLNFFWCLQMNRIEAIYEGFKEIEKEWRHLKYIGELTLKRLNINIPKHQEDDFIPKDNKEYPQDAP